MKFDKTINFAQPRSKKARRYMNAEEYYICPKDETESALIQTLCFKYGFSWPAGPQVRYKDKASLHLYPLENMIRYGDHTQYITPELTLTSLKQLLGEPNEI